MSCRLVRFRAKSRSSALLPKLRNATRHLLEKQYYNLHTSSELPQFCFEVIVFSARLSSLTEPQQSATSQICEMQQITTPAISSSLDVRLI
jgi:hypothetical protein